MIFFLILIALIVGYWVGRIHQCRLYHEMEEHPRRMTDYHQYIEWPTRTFLQDKRREQRELRLISGGRR